MLESEANKKKARQKKDPQADLTGSNAGTVDTKIHRIKVSPILLLSMWDNEDIDKSPNIISAIKEIIQSDEGKDIKIGEIKNRYSKTIENSYLSFGCFYCDALFGDYYLTTEKMEALDDPNKRVFSKMIDLGTSNSRILYQE